MSAQALEIYDPLELEALHGDVTSLQDEIEALQAERQELRRQLQEVSTQLEFMDAALESQELKSKEAIENLQAINSVLDRESITLEELLLLAKTRAVADLGFVLDACPEDLKITLAGFEPEHPDLARLALSGLKPGSVKLLTDFGICTFGDRDSDSFMEVTLAERTWGLADLAKAWLVENHGSNG